MKTRFRALIQRSNETNELEAIYIPSLKYSQFFSTDSQTPQQRKELQLFTRLGAEHYLEEKIPKIIKHKKKKGEEIADSSTAALMTQGLTELNGPSHNYELYFVKHIKDIKASHIENIAIIFVGEAENRTAYIISNGRFHTSENKRWSHNLTLTPSQLIAIENIKFNSKEPARITGSNFPTLDQMIRQVTGSAGWIYLGKNSYPLDIHIIDRERRSCNFFTRTMPTFTRVSILFRSSVSTLLNLGLVDSADNPLFPDIIQTIYNNATGNSTDVYTQNPHLRPFNITQTALGYAMMLAFVFAGTRTRTLAGLGLQIDDACIKLYEKMCGPKPKNSQSKKSAKKWDWLEVKISITKVFFFVLILNQMFLSTLWSYLRITTLSATIANSRNPMFSEKFIKDISLAEWALDLLNEPALIVAEAAFIIYIVENYFRPVNLLQAINAMLAEDKLTAPENRKKDKLLIEMSDSIRRPLIVDEVDALRETKEPDYRITIASPTLSPTQSTASLFSPRNPQKSKVPKAQPKEDKSYCLVM